MKGTFFLLLFAALCARSWRDRRLQDRGLMTARDQRVIRMAEALAKIRKARQSDGRGLGGNASGGAGGTAGGATGGSAGKAGNASGGGAAAAGGKGGLVFAASASSVSAGRVRRRKKSSAKNTRKLNTIFDVASEEMGKVENTTGTLVSKIAQPLGATFDTETDFKNSGLGAIGLGFGLYSYYSRRNEFEGLMKVLDNVYTQKGVCTVADQQYSDQVVQVNHMLKMVMDKLERANTVIMNKLDTLMNLNSN